MNVATQAVRPDMHAAAVFLEHLEANGVFSFQCFDDSKDKRPELARVLHGTLAQHADELTRLNEQGAGVFVAVNATDGRGRKAENVVAVRALFVDADDVPLPEAWHVRPSIINKRDERHWHAFWAVSDMPLSEFGTAQKRLAAYYHTDPKVSDLPRVMRLPGFFHRKGEPILVTTWESRPETYTVPEVLVRLPELPASIPAPQPATLPASQGDNERLFSAWAAKAGEDAVEGNRNNQLFRIAAEGCGRGLSLDFVQSVCLEHANGLAETEVRRTVQSAYRKERSAHPPPARAPDAKTAAAPVVVEEAEDEPPTLANYHALSAQVEEWRHSLTPEEIFVRCVGGGHKPRVVAYILRCTFGWDTDETEARYRKALKAKPAAPPPPAETAPQAAVESRAQSLSLKDLLSYDVEDNADCLLGKRYLCRGQSLLLPGPTGIGKSSLVIQMALVLALGKDFFGIMPTRPLRSLVLQAENDLGDLADMTRGVVNGLDLPVSKIKDGMTVISETSVCGAAFHLWARTLILRYRPDIVVVDPVFGFLGGNASDQGVVSTWLRNGLGTISQETGAAWILVHHVKKPAEVELARKDSDYAYLGFGSVEFANFCRGVLALRDVGSGRYELRAAKRGSRSGLVDNHGQPTDTVFLRHARAGICWERADEPEDERVSGEEADAQEVFDHMEPGKEYNTNGLIQLACEALKKTRGNFTNPAKRGARVLKIIKDRTKKPGQNWLFLKTAKDTALFPGGIH
ncbi:MAG: AAA family ATPase [Planctomycetota bacterium]|nr:AAA family ATPase [Planctomycetota bacterium]